MQKLLKPAAFVEKMIVESILENRFLPGAALPAERILARQLGVTRPTLREALQRLSKEGWVTIQHGKSTRINDYLKDGGLGILSSLVRYGESLPERLVTDLLEVRTAILPDIVQKAVENNREELLAFLGQAKDLGDNPALFAEYDWQLQIKMVMLAGNPVFNMIYNDFKPLYDTLGQRYFNSENNRKLSIAYYNELMSAVEHSSDRISDIVKTALTRSREAWLEFG